MTPEQLFKKLEDHGGAIYSSDRCDEMIIAVAKFNGDFAVNDNGYGYVYMPDADAERQLGNGRKLQTAVDLIAGLAAMLDVEPARAVDAARKMLGMSTNDQPAPAER